jgi:predicted Na+-dependent transporter
LFLFFAQFWKQIIDTFGTGTIGFAIFFIAIAVVIGYFLGGKDQGTKRVSALGTAQRNIAAGILTATVNFQDRPMVGVTVLVVSLVGLVMLMVLAGEWGRKKSDEGSIPKKESPVS